MVITRALAVCPWVGGGVDSSTCFFPQNPPLCVSHFGGISHFSILQQVRSGEAAEECGERGSKTPISYTFSLLATSGAWTWVSYRLVAAVKASISAALRGREYISHLPCPSGREEGCSLVSQMGPAGLCLFPMVVSCSLEHPDASFLAGLSDGPSMHLADLPPTWVLWPGLTATREAHCCVCAKAELFVGCLSQWPGRAGTLTQVPRSGTPLMPGSKISRYVSQPHLTFLPIKSLHVSSTWVSTFPYCIMIAEEARWPLREAAYTTRHYRESAYITPIHHPGAKSCHRATRSKGGWDTQCLLWWPCRGEWMARDFWNCGHPSLFSLQNLFWSLQGQGSGARCVEADCNKSVQI